MRRVTVVAALMSTDPVQALQGLLLMAARAARRFGDSRGTMGSVAIATGCRKLAVWSAGLLAMAAGAGFGCARAAVRLMTLSALSVTAGCGLVFRSVTTRAVLEQAAC